MPGRALAVTITVVAGGRFPARWTGDWQRGVFAGWWSPLMLLTMMRGADGLVSNSAAQIGAARQRWMRVSVSGVRGAQRDQVRRGGPRFRRVGVVRRVRAARRVRSDAGGAAAGRVSWCIAGDKLAPGGQRGVEQLVEVGERVAEVLAVACGHGRDAVGVAPELLEAFLRWRRCAGEAGVVVGHGETVGARDVRARAVVERAVRRLVQVAGSEV